MLQVFSGTKHFSLWDKQASGNDEYLTELAKKAVKLIKGTSFTTNIFLVFITNTKENFNGKLYFHAVSQ